MPSDIVNALAAVVDRLTALAETDPDLRQDLQKLAQVVLEVTEPADGLEPTEPQPVPEEEPDHEIIPASEAIKSLQLGEGEAAADTEVSPGPRPAVEVDDADLPDIEARCRLKAEGSRWAATRLRRIQAGADFEFEVAPADREIINRAKQLPNCYLWMNHPSGPCPQDLGQLDDLAECFETLAEAVALAKAMTEEGDKYPDIFEESLQLLAEAQSAVRAAVQRIDGPTDHDQQRVFNWLRQVVRHNQIFIDRHMRIDDPAAPTNSEDLAARIDDLDNRLQAARKQEKQRRKWFNKLRYVTRQIQSNTDEPERHWETLIRTVNDLVADGIPPSNREMREILLPVADDFADVEEVPPNVQLVLREIDRYLATVTPRRDGGTDAKPTEEVREVGKLLKGKKVFLVGGERRPHAHEAIKTAFALDELIWFDTKEHESTSIFEPYVAREEVALVLLAIRWSSHSYGEVKQFCDEHGKPLVRLPAGYNPNQVAMQILEQCGERLRMANV